MNTIRTARVQKLATSRLEKGLPAVTEKGAASNA